MSMIQVNELSKIFTVHKKAPGFWGSVRSLIHRESIAKHAVQKVSFVVGEGEILGLIGANGAGKTTLVKMLTGIIHPSAGEARVLGHNPWQRHNDFRRQISLIMGQKAQLWWDLPAADCFLLLREIYQIEPAIYHKRLDQMTQMLGITDEINVQIRRLSLGERMKMELIAALLHAPKVVFLDEPTIGLDLTAQRAIREFLLEYREQHHPAMILTSHYMEDIERLCQRIIILREGQVVYDGGLEQVVSKYAGNKKIHAHIRHDDHLPAGRDALANIAKIEKFSDTEIQLSAARDRIPEAVATVLAHYDVLDLNIENEDIGTIIESILRSTGSLS